jgi:DNA-binding transcriptional regulator/RsmH inhibitor MraZ
MEFPVQVALSIEPPRGMYPGRLDDRGRVKLPVPFQQYFTAVGTREKTLFVTSLDRRIAQIYPLEIWRQNEKFFASCREQAGIIRKVAFNANDLGVETEMDSQGRITFPPELRQALQIENSPVRMVAVNGRIEVMSEAIYEERKRLAAEVTDADMESLIAAGLN